MAFVRLVKELTRDAEIGKRVVPIIPDEARTFGMDAFFSNLKIYNQEKELLEMCAGKNFKNVATAVDSGSYAEAGNIIPVPFLIFEKADGDIRRQFQHSRARVAFDGSAAQVVQ